MEKRSSEGDDGYRCVDGDACEGGDVFAAMHICAKMRSGCVSEQDERKSGNVSGGDAISFNSLYIGFSIYSCT